MSQTLTGKSPDKLEEKLASYKELEAQRKLLEERLAKAEAEKGSVSQRIYEKVRNDYARKLDDLRSQSGPLRSEIEGFLQEARGELSGLEGEIRTLEDELAEADFRRRIGEYDEVRYNEVKSRLKPDLDFKMRRKADLSVMLETGPKKTPAGPAKETAPDRPPVQSRETTGPHSVKTPPAGRETERRASVSESSFENPQAWLDEFGELKSTDNRRQAAARETTAASGASKTDNGEADPLSALADPSDTEGTQQARAGGKGEEDVAIGFPNLIIKSGPQSGKKIPLLPMTMSIGREHDNNIELKDPEVARYHARIRHERGKYVLEDLEGSGGLFLNGVASKKAALKNGDVIRLGGTELYIDFE